MTLTAEHRLVTYGTLAPGRINNHQLGELNGTWTTGTVRGRLVYDGWGSAHGYPGIILSADGEDVEVFVFESTDLPSHWQRLDAFEGDGYRRTKIPVVTDRGAMEGYIYELAKQP